MKRAILTLFLVSASVQLAISPAAMAGDDKNVYAVTITNVTNGVLFTPIIAATHDEGLKISTPGMPASAAIARIAEGGDTSVLEAELAASPKVHDIKTSGPLPPGHSVTLTLDAGEDDGHVSLAAMLLPTNDGMVALVDVPGPEGKGKGKGKGTVTYHALGYDGGSEINDELCANIPGPHCGGAPFSAADGEGYVHVHRGIHGIADLSADAYDWRNPVAIVAISRVAP